MSVLKYLLPTVAVAVTVASSGFAQSMERDTEALSEFAKQKRSVSLRDIGGDLSLSGQVRFEYQNVSETANGAVKRGSGSGVANHSFDAEVNLMLDYRTDNTWAAVKLEFDNNAGSTASAGDTSIGSGGDSSCRLERAYVGYNVFEEDTARFDLEVGRRKLYDIFDSKVQFAGTMDGVLLKYANSFQSVGDFYANGGTWIVDDVVDHYAWAVEMGLMDMVDTGLYMKYSYISWDKGGVDRTGNKPGQLLGQANVAGMGRWWESRNSQLTVGYKFQPEMFRTDLNLYGAYLVNHASDKLVKSGNKKKNKAWYVGARLGKVEYAGDWSLDLNYQSVGAQAVLDQEVAGIGRGNTAGNAWANQADNTAVGSAMNGAANYKGYAVEALYAVTDNWTWLMEYESSNPADKKVGGRNSYHKFEVEAIYTF